jgi:hypothetical protein
MFFSRIFDNLKKMLMNGNGRNLYLSVNRGAELQIRNSGKD